MKRLLPLLLLGGCTSALAAPTGVQLVPLPAAAILKTAAVNGALEEIDRSGGGDRTRRGVYLDTMVGPTPARALYEWAHPRPWLDAMVGTKKVDGLFGMPAQRAHMPASAYAIEVGEPYPVGPDSLAIAYDWCVRNFRVRTAVAGFATAWRDLFIRSDTGWARVSHARAVAPAACTP